MVELALVANTRIPSERAQALQVVQAASAFARAGADVTLLYARRERRVRLPAGRDVFEHYQVPRGRRPALVEIPCADAIERFPRALQALPARLQELSFSANAAAHVLRELGGAAVLSREVACAARLLRRGKGAVFLELHRVPERWMRRPLLAAASGARGIVAISGGVRDNLLALGVSPEKVLVEHDGYEPARFERAPTRAEARARLRVDAGATLVVYTGGLLEWKGADLLAGAARELPDVRFLVAGGLAADVERLRELARGLPNLRVDGFQPPERVADYLFAADAGVVPNRSQPAISSRYTSPLKVFEAFAAGLPLVASDLPSLRELLAHGEDAWLVAPDDPRALADGLRRVLADRELRERFRARGLARAPEHTWDARARRILAWMAARG
jgi:glycosyltransferase involved in cell wall biosynthesis